MSKLPLKGIYSATFSIYDKNMNVIKPSVKKLLEYNLSNGIKGFYVGGNTGECTVLPNKTRIQMLETVKEYAGDATVIAHIGAGHFEDTMDLLEHANTVGVDAVSTLPPSLTSYYSDDEILEYYSLVAKKAKSPLYAYVTPVLTSEPVSFAKKIMQLDNVAGVKLTIPNYYIFEKMKLVADGKINLLNGPDECMLAGLAMGADGAIGTTYNLMPKTACAIYDNFVAGDISEAQKNQHRLNRLIDVLVGNNMAGWKVPLKLLDIDPGHTVEPARLPDDAKVNDILCKIKALGYDEEIKL